MALGLRVTFNSLASHASHGMTSRLSELVKAQTTLTTGKNFQHASDDPAAAAQVGRLNNALADLAQYRRNGDNAKAFLAHADTALDGVGALVRQARDITVQAASATNNNTPEAREVLATQIGRIKEQVVNLASAEMNGRYLFAGQRTNTRPFDPTDATNTYQGDTGSLRVETDRGQFTPINLPGDALFGQLLDDLGAAEDDIRAGGAKAANIQAMTDGLNRVLSARGTVGARINGIEDTRNWLDTAEQDLRTLLSNTEDADLTQAFVTLQAAENAYQASLASTARTFQNSLMDFLR